MKKLIFANIIGLLLLVVIGSIIYYKARTDIFVPFVGLVGILVSAIIYNLATRNENKIQRLVELKKSIYLEASESLAKMQAMLSSMTKIDLNKIDPDIGLMNSIQKIDLVAKIGLIKKVKICTSYYQKALQEMIFDKMEIDNINNNAKYALDRHSEYRANEA